MIPAVQDYGASGSTALGGLLGTTGPCGALRHTRLLRCACVATDLRLIAFYILSWSLLFDSLKPNQRTGGWVRLNTALLIYASSYLRVIYNPELSKKVHDLSVPSPRGS